MCAGLGDWAVLVAQWAPPRQTLELIDMRHDIPLVEESASVLRPQLPEGRLTSSVPVRRTTEKDDNMDTTIRKAVIPAAGMGSRLLPLTKAIPKEMLPVGDRPVI